MDQDQEIVVVDAILPEELELSMSSCVGTCQGDGCNSDTGGCPSDASCGQDC